MEELSVVYNARFVIFNYSIMQFMKMDIDKCNSNIVHHCLTYLVL
jgi:hypothetical protein